MTERTALHFLHQRLGARFTEFGGWELPVQYESVIAEHRAVRGGCGWFDVSHLGRFRLEGKGATEAIRSLLCNDIDRIGPGRAQYTLMLNDDGGVIDDLIVWRWDDNHYWVLPNASNHQRVMEAFTQAAPSATVEDLRPTTAMIAVQGPDAPEILEETLGAAPGRFRLFTAELGVSQVSGAGTGYTGEAGGELVIDADHAESLAQRLVEAGAVACGLAARDLLRLEAGYPL